MSELIAALVVTLLAMLVGALGAFSVLYIIQSRR